MRKILVFTLLIFTLAFLPYAYADKDDAWAVGRDSSGEYYWRINSSGSLLPGTTGQNDIGSSAKLVNDIFYNGTLTADPAASAIAPYEVFSTGDTLTAADSGRKLITYFTTTYGQLNFTLPAVSAGLEYNLAIGHSGFVKIDPNGTNQIMYSTCDAGDSIKNSAVTSASGESVTLVSDGTRWYVTEMKGTWTDNGA